ncbi:MAG: molybdopterin-dependent oxidoreductase [Coriobacteriia bacterium]|nr:molybdopterin-dependent oxidoreductase [Coriobacteriia bacterium]
MRLRKIILNINGADRAVICNPELDSLADILRRIGLTGTKVGCGTGQCGACSVILNGKVTRSCVYKTARLNDFDRIVTIEGIGTPLHMHPLQQAFITCGAVQCGFCSPGFIVSAYALLLEDPDPTRTEVRAWFQKYRNACRCTGYKQIVDAVIAAAKVMRGEASMDDMIFKPLDNRYYNTRTPRPSGPAKVCGVLDYGDDVALKMPEGTLHLAIVQPRVAHHAKILDIDISVAEAMPGVCKVITAKDVRGNNRHNTYSVHKRAKVTAPCKPFICDETIFRYGDVIAVVAADTRHNAREAAKAVKLAYEKLPEYLSFPEAVTPDALQIHPETPNIYIEQPVIKGEDAAVVITRSAHAIEGRFRSPREPHLSIEGDVVQAYWGDDGMLTIHCKSQHIYGNLNSIAKGIGLDVKDIRLIHNGVGGSFGWSVDPSSLGLAAICCMATDRPVSLVMSYDEFMHFTGKRCPAHTNGRLACDEKGNITALEYDIGVDHGAYTENDTIMGKLSCFGMPYHVPNLRGLVRLGVTNHAFGIAYRGYGFPQISTGMESLVEMLADEIGMDPFEFRAQNVIKKGELTVNGRPMPDYPYEGMFEMARPYYYERKALAEQEDTKEVRRAVGVATLYFSALAGPFDKAECTLELMGDGRIRINNTWQDVGQGGDVGSLEHTLEALKPLGLTPEDIQIDINDSKYCPDTGIAASSRSHYMCGNAIIDAAGKLLDAMRKPDGSYRSYEEMVQDEKPLRHLGHYDIVSLKMEGMNPDTGQGIVSPVAMYGILIADVAVDSRTGKTEVIKLKMWADAGVIGNYDAAEGQAFGGLSHDIGLALSEDYVDVDKHDNMLGAGLPYIRDVPDDMEVVWIEDNPRPGGPHGSSGLSELFQCGEHMAIINAIHRATGVRVYELPAYPERVKAGLEKLARGEAIEPPEKYYLGSDLYDELEDLAAHPISAAPRPVAPETKP